METLERALPHAGKIIGVGLDSSEAGNPPEKFSAGLRSGGRRGIPRRCPRRRGGPADYIWQALDLLGVQRVDHGVRCLEDRSLVHRLATDQVPLTVCPLSNVKLRVVDTLSDHPLATMLDRGLCATVNSDDPAYFGGYVGENLTQVAAAVGLDDDAVIELSRNSFRASFLDDDTKARYLGEIDGAIDDRADSP